MELFQFCYKFEKYALGNHRLSKSLKIELACYKFTRCIDGRKYILPKLAVKCLAYRGRISKECGYEPPPHLSEQEYSAKGTMISLILDMTIT
jgi:hypothetical protein